MGLSVHTDKDGGGDNPLLVLVQSSASRAAVAAVVARVEITLLLELAAAPCAALCSEPPCSARMSRERGFSRSPWAMWTGRTGGTLGRDTRTHDRGPA